jgi:hypothetical protein
MATLFGGSSGGTAVQQPLPTPKVTRMPTETDPSVLDASKRSRRAAMARHGRQSTILTDQLQETIGSSGQKLGA